MLSSINEKIPSLKAISIDSIKDLESQPHEYSLLKQDDSVDQPIDFEFFFPFFGEHIVIPPMNTCDLSTSR